jgi:hypothetical protein
VRDARKPHSACLSTQDGVDLQALLQKIVSEDFYMSDYNQITKSLLFDNVTYSEAIEALQKVLDSGYFK